MDAYRELWERLKRLQPRTSYLYQGVVKSVEGLTCTVQIDGLDIPDVRIRATITDDDMELLVTPAIGSGVIVGSLTDEFDQLVVLSIDKAEQIIFHGGHHGGLVLVREIAQRLNVLEQDINDLKQVMSTWTPTPQDGGASLKAKATSWASHTLVQTQARDIENPKIKQ